MVVDLLLKMGYGHDKTSGIVTGKPHDGGIDAIIKEDKLGLDSIYIQAKRYDKNNTVGGPAIQQFIGAMGKISKGVFITTGSFSKPAIEEASNPGKQQIDLIDGEDFITKLAEFGIGVKEVKDYEIDEDYFQKI